MKWTAYNSTKTPGKTHIGREIHFDLAEHMSNTNKEVLEKRNNFKDDDIIIINTLCGRNSEHYEKDLQSIDDIDDEFICFLCLKRYRNFSKLD